MGKYYERLRAIFDLIKAWLPEGHDSLIHYGSGTLTYI
jgi:hypothetical protein